MDSNNNPSVSRRSALATIAASTILVNSAPVKGELSSRPDTGQGEVYREGKRGDPISPDAVSDLQNDEFDRMSSSESNNVRLLVVPENKGNYDIVSYAHYVEDGSMHSHFGYALSEPLSIEDYEYYAIENKEEGENRSSDEIQSQVSKKQNEYSLSDISEQRSNTKDFLERGGSEVSTQSAGGFDYDGMEARRTVEDDFGECPYGKVQTEHTLFKANDDDRRWALGTRQRIVPGVNEGCQDDWESDEFSIEHDWSYGTSGEVRDHNPSGNETGSINTGFEITYGAPTVSFSMDVPDVSRTDNSSTTDMDLHFVYNEGRTGTETFRSGSIANLDSEPSANDGLALPKQYVQFRDYICTGGGCGWRTVDDETNYHILYQG